MPRKFVTLNNEDNKVSISLPTSLTEARNMGFQPLKEVAVNGQYFVRDAWNRDKKEWASETFLEKPSNLMFAIECLSFIFSSLVRLALVCKLVVMAINFKNIFTSSTVAEDGKVNAEQSQPKYEFSSNLLKLSLFIVLPSGVFGLASYAAGCLAIDALTERAQRLDSSTPSDINYNNVVEAYQQAGKDMYADVTEDVSTAFSMTPNGSSQQI